MLNRKFVCTPQDIAGFNSRIIKTFNSWNERQNKPKSFVSYLNNYIKHWLSRARAHSIVLDETTREFILMYLKDKNTTNLHYAVHHIIFQLLYAHKSELINLTMRDYRFYEKVTEDCIVESSDPILSKDNKGKFYKYGILFKTKTESDNNWKTWDEACEFSNILYAKEEVTIIQRSNKDLLFKVEKLYEIPYEESKVI